MNLIMYIHRLKCMHVSLKFEHRSTGIKYIINVDNLRKPIVMGVLLLSEIERALSMYPVFLTLVQCFGCDILSD